MSSYILDTDIFSLSQSGHPIVSQHIRAHPPTDVKITVISIEEILSGWYACLRSARQPHQLALAYEHLARAAAAIGGLPILTFPEPAIRRFELLRAMKLNIGKMDLPIAAITLESGGILVTRNLRDFQRVPGLVLEDWTV